MAEKDASNRDDIDVIGSRIKNAGEDLMRYKNSGTTNAQNQAIEESWRKSMAAIATLVKDKEFSGLKTLFNKTQEFSDVVFNTAKMMFALRDAGTGMDDRIKVVESLIKKQSEMKRFMLGQEIKSAFSFGKKEQYKKLKLIIEDDVMMCLHQKVNNMRNEVRK